MLPDVGSQVTQPFRLPRIGSCAGQGTVAPGRVIAGHQAKILVVSDGGITVVFAVQGGARERQHYVGALRLDLPRICQNKNGLGIVVKSGVNLPEFYHRIHASRTKSQRDLQYTLCPLIVPAARRGAAQVEEHIEIVGVFREDGVEGHLCPRIRSDAGAG